MIIVKINKKMMITMTISIAYDMAGNIAVLPPPAEIIFPRFFLCHRGTNHCFIYPKTYRTICCNYFHLITQKIFCELYFLNFIP